MNRPTRTDPDPSAPHPPSGAENPEWSEICLEQRWSMKRPSEILVYFIRYIREISKPNPKALLITLLIFLFLLMPLLWHVSSRYEVELIRDEKLNDTVHMTLHGNALATAINKRFALLEGLFAFAVTNNADETLKRDFAFFASGLHSGTAGIRNFALAPGGVQRYVYPFRGNEATLGHNLILDPRPEVRADVLRTMTTRQIAISGPYELRQGGLGLVARKALYLNNRFWGLVTMVIDMPPVLAEAGFNSQQESIGVALRDGSGKVFFGDGSVFTKDPVKLRLDLPEGFWELASIPEGGWHEAVAKRLLAFKVSGLIASILIAIILYLLISRDISERKLASEMLRESEAKFRNYVERAPDGVFMVDVTGRYLDANDSACRILDYRKEEMVKMSIQDLLAEESLEEGLAHFKKLLEAGAATSDLWHRHRDGSKRCLTVSAARLSETRFLGFCKDITLRKAAQDNLRETLEKLRRAVQTTIQVMVSALEARDPYTAGHQIRTADLAQAIATEMNLPQEKIEGLRIAGSIHDLGKLSIPAEILAKPTKLSEIEFSLIKEHPRQGYEILKNVESPWPLADIVLQHHERMNGSGYPGKLKGDDILIEARILAVADVVEAMASHRPYRPGLGLSFALEEIENNRGIFYDALVVDACLKLFREKGFTLQSVDFRPQYPDRQNK